MVRQHHQLNGHEFEQSPGDGGGQRRLACYGLWGRTESDTTEVTQQQQQQYINMLTKKKNTDDVNVGENVEQLELLHYW